MRPDCIPWTGKTNSWGYGYMTDPDTGKTICAHVWYYQEAHGKVPDGMQLHHTCEFRSCINEGHMKLVTIAEHRKLHGAMVTHCIHGHEYLPSNTNYHPDGRRYCRACHLEASRKRYWKKKGKSTP